MEPWPMYNEGRPSKYPVELREWAVRMVLALRNDRVHAAWSEGSDRPNDSIRLPVDDPAGPKPRPRRGVATSRGPTARTRTGRPGTTAP